jgi:hypothetical protein
MVRDGVANLVGRLRERELNPRRVGDDAWDARCPAHRSTDHALSITRNAFNQVVLECRSAKKCHYFQIVGSLGLTNDHVYEETPDWLINRLRRYPIQPASPKVPNSNGNNEAVQPPHPIPLPVVERAMSDSRCPAEREDGARSRGGSACPAERQHGAHSPGGRGCVAERQDAVFFSSPRRGEVGRRPGEGGLEANNRVSTCRARR